MSDVEAQLKAIYREAPYDRKLTILLALCDITDDDDGFAALLGVTPTDRKQAVLRLARDLAAKARAPSADGGAS